MTEFTREENEVWEKVRQAAEAYLTLTDDDPVHSMEREEICHAFHSIQGWLTLRTKIKGEHVAG